MNEFVKDFVAVENDIPFNEGEQKKPLSYCPVLTYRVARVKVSWTNKKGEHFKCFNVVNPFNGFEMSFCINYKYFDSLGFEHNDLRKGDLVDFTLSSYKYKPYIVMVGVRHAD